MPWLTTFQWVIVGLLAVMAIHYLLLVMHTERIWTASMEGFVGEGGRTSPIITAVSDLYDKFYAKVYDQLMQGDDRARFEAQDLQRALLQLWAPADVHVLDVGCGTGKMVDELRGAGFTATGMDISEPMIEAAQQRHPKSEFVIGDVRKLETWQPGTYSHAVMSYFTIYYFEDKEAIFRNLAAWIQPGGGLAVHMVNKHKFDPLIEAASPFPAFSLQRYSRDRVNRSEVIFDKFAYEGIFELNTADPDRAVFRETFRFKDGRSSRTQEHELFMPGFKQIIATAERAGFKFKQMTDMVIIGYEYQYIVYFTR